MFLSLRPYTTASTAGRAPPDASTAPLSTAWRRGSDERGRGWMWMESRGGTGRRVEAGGRLLYHGGGRAAWRCVLFLFIQLIHWPGGGGREIIRGQTERRAVCYWEFYMFNVWDD